MKRLIAFLGRAIGIRFAPDNYVVPVLRLEQYRRVNGPGFFWIIPFIERTLPPVKTSLYVGNFVFEEVLSRDNIPFTIYLTVLFTFQPASALKATAAQLVRGGEPLAQIIVRDFANRRLRRLVADFTAEKLSAPTVVAAIERDLSHYLKNEMRFLGLAPLAPQDGGVMLKEIIAPEKFKRTMLDVKHNQATLEVLHNYPMPELAQLLTRVIFATSPQVLAGELALMLGSPEGMSLLPWLGRRQGGH